MFSLSGQRWGNESGHWGEARKGRAGPWIPSPRAFKLICVDFPHHPFWASGLVAAWQACALACSLTGLLDDWLAGCLVGTLAGCWLFAWLALSQFGKTNEMVERRHDVRAHRPSRPHTQPRPYPYARSARTPNVRKFHDGEKCFGPCLGRELSAVDFAVDSVVDFSLGDQYS